MISRTSVLVTVQILCKTPVMRNVYWALSGPKMALGPDVNKSDTCIICFEDVPVKNFPAQRSFQPLGNILSQYWTAFGRNGFEKLKRCADVISKWPTTSTSLERSFSQISTHYKTQSNQILCETLLNLHNSMGPSQEFWEAFCATCKAHDIALD